MGPQQDRSRATSNGGAAAAARKEQQAKASAVHYRECQRNHAASIGGYAVDGCREFMASGAEGTAAALLCAACACHRSFHRREVADPAAAADCDRSSTNTSSAAYY